MKRIKPKYQKLNIGCGFKQREGFVNLDKYKAVNPDVVCDIEQGLPFTNNSFSHIYSQHCLEHIRPEHFRFVLNEIARVAKDGCILELELPFDNTATRTNFDHYRTFGFRSFDTLFQGNQRDYYLNLTLVNLKKQPSRLYKLFYYLFPFLKKNIFYKFQLVKK